MNLDFVSPLQGMQYGATLLRLLVVDDDPAEFALIEDGFSRCGVMVELQTATSAPLALAELMVSGRDERPHVALIDINMPLVSGFELAAQMISEGVPTILMSILINGERATHASEMGALDLLAKPADAQGYTALAARVLRVLRTDHVP